MAAVFVCYHKSIGSSPQPSPLVQLLLFFSYSLMTFFVLIPVNSIRCCSSKCCYSNGCCTTYGKALRDSALSPYNDDDKSSELSAEQTCYFFTNYLFVILLFLCSFVSSFIYVRSVYNQGSCQQSFSFVLGKLI